MQSRQASTVDADACRARGRVRRGAAMRLEAPTTARSQQRAAGMRDGQGWRAGRAAERRAGGRAVACFARCCADRCGREGAGQTGRRTCTQTGWPGRVGGKGGRVVMRAMAGGGRRGDDGATERRSDGATNRRIDESTRRRGNGEQRGRRNGCDGCDGCDAWRASCCGMGLDLALEASNNRIKDRVQSGRIGGGG